MVYVLLKTFNTAIMAFLKVFALCVLVGQSTAGIVYDSQGATAVSAHQATSPGLYPGVGASCGPGYSSIMRDHHRAEAHEVRAWKTPAVRAASATPGSSSPWRPSLGPGPLRTSGTTATSASGGGVLPGLWPAVGPGATIYRGMYGDPGGPASTWGRQLAPHGGGTSYRNLYLGYPGVVKAATSEGANSRPAVDYSRPYGRMTVVDYQPFSWKSHVAVGSARQPSSASSSSYRNQKPTSASSSPSSSSSCGSSDPSTAHGEGIDDDDDDDR